MDDSTKVAIIGSVTAISIAILFTPVGNVISHYLDNSDSTPVLTSFKPDKESPQMAETQINWTATADNPRKKTLFYRFNLNGPSTNYTWKIVQNWRIQNQWSWYPTESGDYIIEVQVSDGKKDTTPDSRSMNYIISPASTTWTDAGNDLLREGKYNEAMMAYDQAIKINPQNPIVWYNKGFLLSNLGKYEEAIKAYDKAIEIDPNFSMALNNKGLDLTILGKYNESITAFDKVIEINPQDSDGWSNKGLALYKLNKYDEAIKAYDKAIAINPKFALCVNNKGQALDKLGKFDEAIIAYDKAIEIDQNFLTALNNKAISQYRLNKSNEAMKTLDKALEINPHDSLAKYNKKLLQANINGNILLTPNYGEVIDSKIFVFPEAPKGTVSQI